MSLCRGAARTTREKRIKKIEGESPWEKTYLM